MAYLQLGSNNISKMQLDSAKYFLDKAQAIKLKIDDQEGLGYVYNSLGIIEDYNGRYPEAAQYYLKS
ncbi:MAG: hypothetical protein R2771_14395 [Saprospiraceae bacterium]